MLWLAFAAGPAVTLAGERRGEPPKVAPGQFPQRIGVHHRTYGRLAALVFLLILTSFLVLGFARALVGFQTARLLAAPTTLAAAALAAFLFVRGVLAWVGIAPLE